MSSRRPRSRRAVAVVAPVLLSAALGASCTAPGETMATATSTSSHGVGGAGGVGVSSSGASVSGAGGAGGSELAVFEPGEERPGGDTTVELRDAKSFQRPAGNLSSAHLGHFEAGRALFEVAWTVGGEVDRDGLGPTYVGTSCQGCHFRGGRGAPPPANQPMTSMLVRLSVPSPQGGFLADPRYGDQIQTRGIAGVPAEGWFSVDYEPRPGAYADKTPYELLAPTNVPHELAFGPLAPGTVLSARVAQPMLGLGLLSAIRDEDIEALADPDDADNDGVSGRRNRVPRDLDGTIRPGRFGWKANQPDLEQQAAAAFRGDMGITSPIYPEEDCPAVQSGCAAAVKPGIDIDADRLAAVVFFSHFIAVPYRPDAQEPEVLRGKALFGQAGCAACHRPSFTTGEISSLPELGEQRIYPYTDLLLHAMGPDLADGRPDHEATGDEFRTAPLWGIGLTKLVTGQARFLHDGRARSVEEATLWHGGEAEPAREAFAALSAEDRAALTRFLLSL